jgi:hypothetical protein
MESNMSAWVQSKSGPRGCSGPVRWSMHNLYSHSAYAKYRLTVCVYIYIHTHDGYILSIHSDIVEAV